MFEIGNIHGNHSVTHSFGLSREGKRPISHLERREKTSIPKGVGEVSVWGECKERAVTAQKRPAINKSSVLTIINHSHLVIPNNLLERERESHTLHY